MQLFPKSADDAQNALVSDSTRARGGSPDYIRLDKSERASLTLMQNQPGLTANRNQGTEAHYENSCQLLNCNFVAPQRPRHRLRAVFVFVGRQRGRHIPIHIRRNAHDDYLRVVLCRSGLRQPGKPVRGERCACR